MIKLINYIVTIFLILTLFSITAFSIENSESLRFVYVSDLNLYPTPQETQRLKSKYEKSDGLLLYETQAIFQEIVRYINKNYNCDFVIFGGNNISDLGFTNNNQSNLNVWNLLLDMASEINSKFYIVVGKNEVTSVSNNDLIHALNHNCDLETKYTWWHKKTNSFLLIALDSVLFFNSKYHAKVQLDWLSQLLLKNKDLPTIVFLHEPILSHSGIALEKSDIKNLIQIIQKNKQIKLIVSGSDYINRIKNLGNTVNIISSSPSIYPNSFKYIEISKEKVKVNTVVIPLKGIVKKAEQSLIDSDRAKNQPLELYKSIKNYVLGEVPDRDLVVDFR